MGGGGRLPLLERRFLSKGEGSLLALFLVVTSERFLVTIMVGWECFTEASQWAPNVSARKVETHLYSSTV